MSRDRAAGVILINVLVVLGLSAAVVYAMLTLADLGIARSQAFSEAGQGLALVRAGEQSAIAALRRDMIRAPETDNATEPWAKIGQEPISIPGGSFALTIADAQDRFNLNRLTLGDPQSRAVLATLAEAADLPADLPDRLAQSLELDGPLKRTDELVRRIGLTPEQLARLRTLATVLPGTGDVNLNAAPEALLAAVLDSPPLAASLVARRKQVGYLTARDFAGSQATLPPGFGFRSDLFRLTTTVRIGDTVQSVVSLLQRTGGPPAGAAAPLAGGGEASPPAEGESTFSASGEEDASASDAATTTPPPATADGSETPPRVVVIERRNALAVVPPPPAS